MARFKKLVEEKLRNWEFQPDMFDLDAGVSYADGVQSFNFIDIDDYISAHFPQLEFQGMREKDESMTVSYIPNSQDVDLEAVKADVAKYFGKDVTVSIATNRFNPDKKALRIRFFNARKAEV